MNCKIWYLCIVCFAIAARQKLLAQQTNKANIILIFADDFLFAELINKGHLHSNNEVLFSYRSHKNSTCASMKLEGVVLALSQYVIEIKNNNFIMQNIGRLNFMILIHKTLAWCVLKYGFQNINIVNEINKLSPFLGIGSLYSNNRNRYFNLAMSAVIYSICILSGWLKMIIVLKIIFKK